MAEKINAGGLRKVIMTGFVQGEELEELYSNASLYILPSEIEGMPLSLLEAMSYGNLCLTSDIPENTDVTQEHGVAFTTGNVDALSEKIVELCTNMAVLRKEEKYKSERIRQYILVRYNWDAVVTQTLACYTGTR